MQHHDDYPGSEPQKDIVRSSDPQQTLALVEEFIVSWLSQLSLSTNSKHPGLPQLNKVLEAYSHEENNSMNNHRQQEQQYFLDPMKHGARRYTAFFIILQYAHSLLIEGKTATQRELYYSNINFFQNQQECNEAIIECAMTLGITRADLGIYASSRGFFTGSILIQAGGREIDCTQLDTSGMMISSEWIKSQQTFKTNARYIIVVEKDGVFNRLSEDRFFDHIPCILITGKGFPDVATRAMLYQVSSQCPDIPVLGLCDSNPFGLGLLLTYKHGSARLGTWEGRQWAVPRLRWVGLRPDQARNESLPSDAFQPLTRPDISRLNGLERNPHIQANCKYSEAVAEMKQARQKCELEALQVKGISYIKNFLEKAIISQDYY